MEEKTRSGKNSLWVRSKRSPTVQGLTFSYPGTKCMAGVYYGQLKKYCVGAQTPFKGGERGGKGGKRDVGRDATQKIGNVVKRGELKADIKKRNWRTWQSISVDHSHLVRPVARMQPHAVRQYSPPQLGDSSLHKQR
jgi:hypothetical protein